MRVRPRARAQPGARGGATSAARRVARPPQIGVRQGCEPRISPLARRRREASPQFCCGLAPGNWRPVGSCGAASSRERGRSCPIYRSEQRTRHGRRRLTFPGATARGRLGRACGRQVAVAIVRRSGVLLIAPPAACDHTLYGFTHYGQYSVYVLLSMYSKGTPVSMSSTVYGICNYILGTHAPLDSLRPYDGRPAPRSARRVPYPCNWQNRQARPRETKTRVGCRVPVGAPVTV